MQSLNQEMRQDLIRFLTPFVSDATAYSELVREALGADFPALRSIPQGGRTEALLDVTIDLLQGEEAYPGRNALVAIMDAVRRQVDANTFARFKALRESLIQTLEPSNRADFSIPNHLFISHASQDNSFARRLAASLNGVVADVWIDVHKLKGGHHWRTEIFLAMERAESVVVCLTPSAVDSPWVRREINSALLLKKRIFPIMVQDSHDKMNEYEETQALLDYQYIDFTKHLIASSSNQAINTLVDQLSDPRLLDRSPFKGLEAFQEADAAFFFGREGPVQKLLTCLKGQTTPRFVALVGASGSGKSSIVRAGLLPIIRRGDEINSRDWKRILLTPGDNPMRSLAEGLHGELIGGGMPLADVSKTLADEKLGLTHLANDIMRLAGASDAARLLLVIDQLEEVFSPAMDETARAGFLRTIHAAAMDRHGRCHVVVTMRADYLDRLGHYPDVAALFEGDNLIFATDMRPGELLQTIEGPARIAGLVFESGLSNQIVQEVADQPGALPLLQYALKQLYQNREGRRITFAAYTKIGGVQQALAQHAEEVYQVRLSPSGQAIARRILLELVTTNPETMIATSRPRKRSDLTLTGHSPQDVAEVVNLLTSAENRLLVSTQRLVMEQDESHQEVYLQISHEALVRHWELFRQWIDQDIDRLRLRDRFEEEAADWQVHQRDPAYLLSGTRLDSGREWLHDPDAQEFSTTLQREFITASINERDRQEALERRRLGRQIAGLFTALVIVSGLAFIALYLRGVAEDRQRDAEINESQALSTAALQQIFVDPVDSLRLSREALFDNDLKLRPHTVQAEFALTQALQYSLERAYVETGIQTDTHVAVLDEWIAAGGDALWLLSSDLKETIELIPAGTVSNLTVARSSDGVYWLSYVPSGSTSQGQTGLTVWQGDTPVAEVTGFESVERVEKVIWRPTYHEVIAYAASHVWSWQPLDGAPPESLMAIDGLLEGMACSPDGQHLAVWGRGESGFWIRLLTWDAAAQSQRAIEWDDPIDDIVWAPDGRRLLVIPYQGRTAAILKGDDPDNVPIRTDHSSNVRGGAFLDNERALTWSEDGDVRVWGTGLAQDFGSPELGEPVGFVVSPDGNYLLVYLDTGSAYVWDLSSRALVTALRGHTASISSATWHGKYVLTTSADRTARIWEVDPAGRAAEERITLYGHTDRVLGGYWLDDQRVMTYSKDGSFRVWEVLDEAGLPLCLGRDSEDYLWCRANTRAFAFDDSQALDGDWMDDDTIAVVSSPGELGLLHWQSGIYEPMTSGTIQAAWSPDLSEVFTYGPASPERIWDLQTGKPRLTLDSGALHAYWLAAGLLIVTPEQRLELIDPQTGDLRFELSGDYRAPPSSVASSHSGRYLAANSDSSVLIWDADTGKLESDDICGAPDMACSWISTIQWSPDDRYLVTIDYEGTVRLWDAKTYTQVWDEPFAPLPPGSNIAGAAVAAFSPSGDQLAIGIAGNLYLLKTSSREPLWEVDREGLLGLRWNHDGSRLLTWGQGNTEIRPLSQLGKATVWDVESRERVLLVSEVARITQAAFNRDESRLLTTSRAGTVVVWPTGFSPQALMKLAQSCCMTRLTVRED